MDSNCVNWEDRNQLAAKKKQKDLLTALFVLRVYDVDLARWTFVIARAIARVNIAPTRFSNRCKCENGD